MFQPPWTPSEHDPVEQVGLQPLRHQLVGGLRMKLNLERGQGREIGILRTLVAGP